MAERPHKRHRSLVLAGTLAMGTLSGPPRWLPATQRKRRPAKNSSTPPNIDIQYRKTGPAEGREGRRRRVAAIEPVHSATRGMKTLKGLRRRGADRDAGRSGGGYSAWLGGRLFFDAGARLRVGVDFFEKAAPDRGRAVINAEPTSPASFVSVTFLPVGSTNKASQAPRRALLMIE